ncbi:MAG TPA: hypothetical protein VEU97_16265 [Ktedonobacteraceae bacterium]|nr:hypothetical protein [Ktedonobacteraceae bacterium]
MVTTKKANSTMPEHISTGDYEIRFDPEQPYYLQIIDMKTERSMQVTAEEAINMLRLMYKHRDELQTLRTGG